MSGTSPSYEELLRALEQLEHKFHALEKAHTQLLLELQDRLIKIQANIDGGLPRQKPPPH